ncbi:MAG TPA: amino acid ABC transporter substrate-binding protein [Lachnoclostridium phytofermentans]|uniref:Amino acid ABC transporter substrate-binding protein n=1 Tax=Lachnoclostridium phytofermentans TaxID=66219 RepID=A0A3D2X585_9FIRM|nr:transporter substrate-binding domain-containing protein [Lachnoclostridium sp.]HCL02064.1 amino acid ABC transporter substrate-binding protein [Lachnoclostridium phytofermentans]
MKLKKVMAVVLAGVMVASLAGCSSKSNVKINAIADLKGTTVGVQTGTTGDILVTDDKELGVKTVEHYNKGFEAVQALMQGKIDAVVIDDQPAKVFVEKNKGLKIIDEEYTSEAYAIGIAKGNTELKDKINAAIAQIKEDGTLQGIIDYYIGNVEGATPYAKKDVDRPNGTLVMATNAEFPPYESIEGNSVVGLDVDMAQAIADILGMELKVEDMAFDSIIANITSGKSDIGVAGLTDNEERRQSIDFSDSYYTGRQVIIVKE